MMQNQKYKQLNCLRQNIPFWLSLYRGGLAVVLGMVLIFYPTKTQNLLVNVIGFFWLSTGFALLRQPIIGKRTSTMVGLIIALSGLLVVSRNFIRHWVDEIVVINVLGMVVLMTGVLHIMSGLRIRASIKQKRFRKTLHFLLGAFECFLGVLLLSSPLERGPMVYWVATIWSLLFGTLVIGNALNERFRNQLEPESQ